MPELRNPLESGFSEFPRQIEPVPHEVLEAQGFEYVRSDIYPDEETAQRALELFRRPLAGQPDFSKVYNPESFRIVPYKDGFMIYGKKTVHSAFAGRGRARRSA